MTNKSDPISKGQRAQDWTPARKLVRNVLAPDSLPRRLWRRYKPAETTRLDNATIRRSGFDVLVDVAGSTETRGVYLYGGCDAERLLDMGEWTAPRLTQSLAVTYEGHVASSRPDILLQKLQGVPIDDTAEVVERLSLDKHYFEPNYFAPTFDVGSLSSQPVRKHAIVTNIAAAVTRTLYRHKEHGFLIDPGGWWLAQSAEGVVPDRDTLKWFRKNFKSIGRLSVDEWETQFRAVHAETIKRTEAKVLALNLLTVEPQDPTHIYSGRTTPETVRRREFAIRLFQVAEELGICVVDADRLLKESGVKGAVDFAHMPREQLTPLMHESANLLISEGVIRARPPKGIL